MKEDIHIAYLTQKSYKKILGLHNGQKLKEKLNFFHNFKIFSDFTIARMSSLLFLFESFEAKRNQIIFKEGDISNYLYFIKSGEVEVKHFKILKIQILIRYQKKWIFRIQNRQITRSLLTQGETV